MPEEFRFSSGSFDLALFAADQHLVLNALTSHGNAWIHPLSPSALFRIDIAEKHISALDLAFRKFITDSSTPGIQKGTAQFDGPGYTIDFNLWVYTASMLVELWPVIQNQGPETIHISRIDSFSLNIPPAGNQASSVKGSFYELLSFTSDWGKEFEPLHSALLDQTVLETRLGRSSKGAHPWFALYHPGGEIVSGSIAWSGNWIFRFEPIPQGGFQISSGLNDWQFSKDLPPGGNVEAPHAILAFGRNLDEISHMYARVGRKYWYPANQLSAQLPVEWNHWWSYEDAVIDEGTFLNNSEKAADLGIEVCTLDAGWFGPPEADPIIDTRQSWFAYRGDWSQVNTRRFPHGIRPLVDDVHQRGMYFGLWCEIEGMGSKAALAGSHPDFPAIRDGTTLGYICLGNLQAQEWAFQTLSNLIQEYQCDWIKLDFNVDPGAGCNRPDHGHGKGDGLFEHYLGYYHVLDRLRAEFPRVVLENCSSGGLRIDLGMLHHTHFTFLSDPDWPVHDLQIFWGASCMLAPSSCLHWSFSDWRYASHPPQTFNPFDPLLTQQQLDFYTRTAMLGAMGFSQRLPELPSWISQRMAYHIQIYRQQVRRFIRLGEVWRLTGQPRRDGSGDRWTAFQYSLEEEDHHLLFVFRLPGSEAKCAIHLSNLKAGQLYRVTDLDGRSYGGFMGKVLMDEGLRFEDIAEEGSALLRISLT